MGISCNVLHFLNSIIILQLNLTVINDRRTKNFIL